jgi:HEPN pEK499 p136
MDKNIPRLAYIEAQILHRAARLGSLNSTARLVEVEYKIPPGTLGNGIFFQTRTLSLLFLLIVLPKEYWVLKETAPIYSKTEQSWSVNNVRVVIDSNDFKNPVYAFIHHLRNAVAHAHFEFVDNTFVFWNQKNKQTTYKAEVSFIVLENFLEVVGSIMSNHSSQ